MSQWAKCTSKHEDLSSDPGNPRKTERQCMCVAKAGEVETELTFGASGL